MAMTPYITFFLFLLFATAEGAKILIISHVFGKSHHSACASLADGLTSHKHDVTLLTYFPHKFPNLTTILMKSPDDAMGDMEFVKDFVLNAYKNGPTAQFMKFVQFAEGDCDNFLKDEATKKLLATGKQFDAVIVDVLFGECSASAASLVAKHVMYYYTSNWFVPWMNHAVPTPYSYVPNSLERLPTKMNFWQRFQNAVTFVRTAYVHQYYLNAAQQKVLSKYVPRAPKIEVVPRLIAFSLINGDAVTVSPRPMMPNMIDTGAMHCREAKPLPKDLKDFVEDSGDDGFIVFGLGSYVRTEFMNAEFFNSVIKTFSGLKQKIIWKFEGQLDNLPPNVKIIKWMPQQDLLGHPKARLFITHSGLLSLQEAIYHAVPMLGMPFFADQQGNMARIQDLGIGEILDFEDVTFNTFSHMINKILNDERYYSNMKRYSAIFKDQPQRAIDIAVYWTEYVIRHDGARHLKSAAEELNFVQYFLLDIAALFGFVAAVVLGISVYIVIFFLKKLFRRKEIFVWLEKKIQ